MAPAAATLVPVSRVSWVTVRGHKEQGDRMLWEPWPAQGALPGHSDLGPSLKFLPVTFSSLFTPVFPLIAKASANFTLS